MEGLAVMRPAVSVIVPFAGPQHELETTAGRLAAIEVQAGDELVIVDNRPRPEPVDTAPGIEVLASGERPSSWYARNRGVAATSAEWILFVDSDTRPSPGILDAYFSSQWAPDVGIVAGGVRDWLTRDTRCSRYVSARAKMDQRHTLEHPYMPYAQTANCAVRRAAFTAAGGFSDSGHAAGDADLSWRLQSSGWRLEYAPDAYVDHENRTRVRDLLRQLRRHGAGLAWLEERYPGSAPPPSARELAGRIPRYLLAALRAGSREQSLYALLDLLCLYARDAGRIRSERWTS